MCYNANDSLDLQALRPFSRQLLQQSGHLRKAGVKMAEEMRRLVTLKDAARYLRVSMFTLIKKQDGPVPYRTPGGHRRIRRVQSKAESEALR